MDGLLTHSAASAYGAVWSLSLIGTKWNVQSHVTLAFVFLQLHRSEATEACATTGEFRHVGKFAGPSEEHRVGSAIYGLPACEHSSE